MSRFSAIRKSNNLVKNPIEAFPDDAETISVIGQKLSAPLDLGRFTNLKTLVLVGCNLDALPDNLPIGLERLECDNNNLNKLPDLTRLLNLAFLSCNSNNITEIPDFADGLTVLKCAQNDIRRLPDSLRNVVELNCSNNRISNLPILENTRVETLYCNGNELKHIPAFPPTMTEFHCSNNPLQNLPPLNVNLQSLYVTNTQIATLPRLNTNLTVLHATNNPFLPKLLRVADNELNDEKRALVNMLIDLRFENVKNKNKSALREYIYKRVIGPAAQRKWHPRKLQFLLSSTFNKYNKPALETQEDAEAYKKYEDEVMYMMENWKLKLPATRRNRSSKSSASLPTIHSSRSRSRKTNSATRKMRSV